MRKILRIIMLGLAWIGSLVAFWILFCFFAIVPFAVGSLLSTERWNIIFDGFSKKALFGMLALMLLFWLTIYLLRKKKFIIPIILSLFFYLLSPLVFIWLEIHLLRQKRYALFCYVASIYPTLIHSGYFFFKVASSQ